MRWAAWILFAACAALAQGPRNPPTADSFVARMMAFDANGDGKLTRNEVTDERLLRLFDRADTNKDGVVTKEELIALYAQEPAGPAGGPGRGRGGPGPMMTPGQVVPLPVQQMLHLTPEQTRQIAELQKLVDAKLDQLLTSDQKSRLKDMGQFRPGTPGPPDH